MSKKIISIGAFLVVCCLIALGNLFTRSNYGINIIEYLKYSAPISQSEREYLDGKGTVYLTSDQNAPPFSFMGENGQYKGLVIDYMSALSIELEAEIQFEPNIWEEALRSVISGESDMIELIPSEEREKDFDFTQEIYTFKSIVLKHKNQNDILDTDSFEGKRVAVQSGDYAIEYIKKTMPPVEIVKTKDAQESIELLLDDKVDAVVGDEPVVVYFTSQLGIEDDVEILAPALYSREITLGVKKSDQKLLNILNKGILNLKKKDFVRKIQQKWLGLSDPIHNDRTTSNLVFITLAIIFILATVSVVIFIWNNTLKAVVKRRTNELYKSKNDLQLTFDAMADFIAIVSENGIIENANQSFCEFLSTDINNLVGSDYLKLPIINKARIGKNEKIIMETDHNGRHYLLFIIPLKSNDHRHLIVIEDDTDKVINQQQILQQNKMIAIGQLAAGVAHEIRNPLGLIRNYSYVLKGKIGNEDTVIEKSISNIESAVLRAGKIVDNLLDFSRKDDHEISKINLSETLNEIVLLDSRKIYNSKVEVIVSCPKDFYFHTNKETITLVMLNLVSNALDATEPGDVVEIKCRRDDRYLYIEVIDTGRGIEPENIEQIFNPFFTTKPAGKGTGLGLYMVYNQLQKINGEISVQSTVGIGTTFKMKFDIKEPQ